MGRPMIIKKEEEPFDASVEEPIENVTAVIRGGASNVTVAGALLGIDNWDYLSHKLNLALKQGCRAFAGVNIVIEKLRKVIKKIRKSDHAKRDFEQFQSTLDPPTSCSESIAKLDGHPCTKCLNLGVVTMVAMMDQEEVDDYTVICKQKNAHARGLVGVWSFRAGNGIVGLVTVGHDCVKLWRMDENVNGAVTLTSKVEIQEFRTAVQSADVTVDGKCICLVTVDSMFYEIILGDEGPVVVPHDFGVMEAWHVRIAKNKSKYITTAFSGFLREIDLNGKVAREEPFVAAKTVGAMAYILLWHIEQPTALQQLPSPHAGAVTAVTFLPTGRHLVSGGEDGVVACYRIPQAGMTSTAHVDRDDVGIGYLGTRDENEPMDVGEAPT
ncbi:unnamed protein product [Nippostrongylus brasiliensis]|uniref:WD_REPEATS_REGION domain-containing protein n=1 Tax=Nippostrongylus brasiliensis TaxID=27835 RepID=A0A0N4YNI7_NIPBR|nr:unnamed protein product [Nippostrongylus brasiliensis]